MRPLSRAFLWVLVAYASALAVALAVGRASGLDHPIAVAAAADLAATLVVFAFSYAFRNSSFYDPYWSVAPIAIVAYWALGAQAPGSDARPVLVLALLALWGLRLTANWARGWQGLHHEDWRYLDLQQRHGRRYWWVSLFGIHLAPTVWVFLGCLPAYAAVAAGARPWGWLDALALLVTAGAIALEALADAQLRAFRRATPRSDALLDTGLWAWSRHPNYLGEMGFWWGLWLFGLAAAPGWWWTVIGPLGITGMFRWASLPMIEERMRTRRPGFAAYAARTPRVIPRPPRRRAPPASC